MVKTVRKNSKNLPAILTNAIYLRVFRDLPGGTETEQVKGNAEIQIKCILAEYPNCEFTRGTRPDFKGDYEYTIRLRSGTRYKFLSYAFTS